MGEESDMKSKLCTGLAFLLAMMLTGCTPDKEAMEKQAVEKQAIEKQIKNQVDEVVAAIDSGKKAEDFEYLSKKEPHFLFIMRRDGSVLFHPHYSSVTGVHLKTIAQGTTEGLWVEYDLHGQTKRSYVKKTKGGLFVVSGYYVDELKGAK
jgi:hypothetical protein